MFSIKSSKLKIALTAFAAVLAVAAVVLLINRGKPAVSDNAISLKASNASERTAFLSQFGWDIEEDPVEVAEVIIPAEFDRGYEKYNEIQKAQNLDLTPYAGKRAKRWTYNIKNYPGYEGDSGTVQANILVYEGAVIGGDICSTELDGFMQGFDFPTKKCRTEREHNMIKTAGRISARLIFY
ncbi:MAG: DUF4830 domain-containing protein [Acutalibacteraceae bacterium]